MPRLRGAAAIATRRAPPAIRSKPSPPRAPVERRLVLNVTVGDVMSRPAASIGRDATLYDALVALRANGFSGLPVLDTPGRVVGVLSERDLVRIFAGVLSRHKVKGLLDVLLVGMLDQPEPALRTARERLEELTVGEAMSSPPYVIRPDAPLELAAEIMVENSINRLPVVEADRLVGIVTRNDLVRAMVSAPT